jgi:hypothetical protein
VAAVSNRVGTVDNGQKLEVLEHGRRFLWVRTDKGEVGWIDEHAVATQDVYDQFQALAQAHAKDSVAATGAVRDDVYLHAKPGRDSDRLYRLQEGEKLKLLARATLPKPLPPGQKPKSVATTEPKAGENDSGKAVEAQPPAPPAMEDWWLVRDSKGDTGWLYSRMMDVDVPDAIGRYSEGQRIVGAYVIAKVNDPEAPQDDKDVPEYLTVLSPYKAGLLYDFDQVRVFTWNLKKHRYETAYRERNIEGYLPVEVKMGSDPWGKTATAMAPAPMFSYRVLSADSPIVIPDPVTGEIAPTKTVLKMYRLEGNLVRRIQNPNQPLQEIAHPEPVSEKKKAAAKSVKGKKRR